MMLRRGRSVRPVGLELDIELTAERVAQPGRRSDYPEPWRPPTEVFECHDGLVVRVEIAGVTLDDLEVEIDGEVLRVRGERIAGYPSGPRLYHESRIRYGSFEAAVRLPFPVVSGEAGAEYVDGLLCIRLPRRVAAKVPMRLNSEAHHPDRGDQ